MKISVLAIATLVSVSPFVVAAQPRSLTVDFTELNNKRHQCLADIKAMKEATGDDVVSLETVAKASCHQATLDEIQRTRDMCNNFTSELDAAKSEVEMKQTIASQLDAEWRMVCTEADIAKRELFDESRRHLRRNLQMVIGYQENVDLKNKVLECRSARKAFQDARNQLLMSELDRLWAEQEDKCNAAKDALVLQEDACNNNKAMWEAAVRVLQDSEKVMAQINFDMNWSCMEARTTERLEQNIRAELNI